MKEFLTKIDLSDSRQVKLNENSEATFNGSLNIHQYSILGQEYSDLKTGLDISTSGIVTTLSPIVFYFTGTTGTTTYFTIPSQYNSIISNLPIITPNNWYGTNFISQYFNSSENEVVDGNSFDIFFSGVQFNFNVYDFGYISSTTTFSGYCSTSYVYSLSGKTYDWWFIKSGSTTWLEVLGRANFKKLSLESLQVPITSGDTGITGTVTWDNDYIYVCVNTNTWKRSPLSSW